MAGRVAGKGVVVTGAGSGPGRAIGLGLAGECAVLGVLDLVSIGDATRPAQAMADFAAGVLRGRPAVPEDLVGTALFLASADSDHITGQIIMADGGMVLV